MKRIGVYLFFGLLFIHFFMVFVCCWFFTFVFSSGTLFSIELPFESWCIHIDNVFKDEFSSVHRDVGGAAIKNPTANAGDTGDMGSIPGSGRFPGVGNGDPFQYFCLENSMDRGAQWASVHGVAKSQTWLSTHTRRNLHGHIIVTLSPQFT